MADSCPNLQLLSLDPALAGQALPAQAGLGSQVLGHRADCQLVTPRQRLEQRLDNFLLPEKKHKEDLGWAHPRKFKHCCAPSA